VIGERCFHECKSLCEVTFESGSKLKEIGKGAFYMCGIKSIGIPSNVEVIGAKCFYHCESLCEVTFESGSKLKEIGGNAFSECRIKSIGIPSNVDDEIDWPLSRSLSRFERHDINFPIPV
jgi:hypothetical protein